MEKYYTPDIEEFHVGFELEDDTVVGIWTNRTIKDPEYLRTISHKSKKVNNKGEINYDLTKICRVKYLDKEDIESLGLLYSSWSSDDEFKDIYTDGTYILFKTRDTNEIQITNGRLLSKQSGHYSLFKGDIKNKSELKRLLKQLNIK